MYMNIYMYMYMNMYVHVYVKTLKAPDCAHQYMALIVLIYMLTSQNC